MHFWVMPMSSQSALKCCYPCLNSSPTFDSRDQVVAVDVVHPYHDRLIYHSRQLEAPCSRTWAFSKVGSAQMGQHVSEHDVSFTTTVKLDKGSRPVRRARARQRLIPRRLRRNGRRRALQARREKLRSRRGRWSLLSRSKGP